MDVVTTHIFVDWENRKILDAKAFDAVKQEVLKELLDYENSPDGHDLLTDAICDYTDCTVEAFTVDAETRKNIMNHFVELCKREAIEQTDKNYQEVFLQITT